MEQKQRKRRNIQTSVLHTPNPTGSQKAGDPSNKICRGQPHEHRAGQSRMKTERIVGWGEQEMGERQKKKGYHTLQGIHLTWIPYFLIKSVTTKRLNH